MGFSHLDLFAGVGGFAYAVDQVWPGAEHIFCETNHFCGQVLKTHWPNSIIHRDIKELWKQKQTEEYAHTKKIDLISGGFPCQGFSQAGKRRGTADDRWLWPEMFRVIKIAKPRWVIAENVPGLINWNGGMAFRQVLSDLESEGYSTQSFIIPACGVGAPHRRDRVWIVAHASREHEERAEPEGDGRREPEAKDRDGGSHFDRSEWEENWVSVATRLCGVSSGVSSWLDERGRKRNSRNERLKALGNAIVPDVAYQIMMAIKAAE